MSLTYYCVVCGECIVDLVDDDDGEPRRIVIHNDVPHPEHLTYDEEEKPQ